MPQGNPYFLCDSRKINFKNARERQREIFKISCLFCDSLKVYTEDAISPSVWLRAAWKHEPSSVIQMWNIGNVIGKQIEIIWEDSVIQ